MIVICNQDSIVEIELDWYITFRILIKNKISQEKLKDGAIDANIGKWMNIVLIKLETY